MPSKENIRRVLKEHYGEFDSYLEIEYENKLTESLILGNLEQKKAWATFNQVVLELKFSLKDMLKVKELLYRLTENTNPKNECINVIEPLKDLTPELQRLYNKIKNL